MSTTAPLSGGGDLSANRTISISQATSTTNGYLSSTDWNAFNGKQAAIAAGTTAQYWRGDKTWQALNTTNVAEGTNLYFTNARAQSAISGGASTIASANLTASRALVSDASGKVGVSTATSTELGFLAGVTSAIQTQLNAMAPKLSPILTGVPKSVTPAV